MGFVLWMMSSCSTSLLTVNSAVKSVNYPGIQSAKPYLKYTIEFEAKSNFTVKKVALNDSDKIESFQLFSIEKKVNVNSDSEHQKGQYILSFKTVHLNKIETSETVFIYTESNHKIDKKKVLLVKKEAIRAR